VVLAYVFWHWAKPDISVAEYEEYQRAFHAGLARAAPQGFQESCTFRVDGQAAWLGGAPAYADCYLVKDSAALDPLNAAAVSGVCEAPHAKVANAMAAGVGSLLAQHADDAPSPPVDLRGAHHATFLTKPRDMPYATFYATVAALPDANQSTLWRRMMVLGPNPEFALLTPTRPEAPATLAPLSLTLTFV
jgi:hypothetical protein